MPVAADKFDAEKNKRGEAYPRTSGRSLTIEGHGSSGNCGIFLEGSTKNNNKNEEEDRVDRCQRPKIQRGPFIMRPGKEICSLKKDDAGGLNETSGDGDSWRE